MFAGRYELQSELGQGGMGIVYRALDRLSSQIVALKQVTVPQEKLAFASSGAFTDFRIALANEFKILASLRHPNIISVLDYGFDENQRAFYTMEYLEDSPTILEFAEDKPLREQVDLLVQVLRALTYLHRRGIIHRDLKPANILVDKHTGSVKVLDFGLAVAHARLEDNVEGAVVGTLAYLAPELLQGDTATVCSDLYAFGVVAHELLLGEHPFNTQDVGLMVEQILYQAVKLDDLELDERIKLILLRLLEKDPLNRYQTAYEILDAYSVATNQSLDYEDSATRESFLQSAEFVGREPEIQALEDALSKIDSKNGTNQASFWLIGGESGVGKTRLLEELRIRAMVQGALVLRGQATVEARAPYHTWRDVLRYLCLHANLNDLEAGVLKSLVPDMDKLIGRTVTEAPVLDPQAHQNRLIQTIQDILARQNQAIVIILEDLQWGRDGVKLLRRVTDNLKHEPIMIIGSYRNDERPNLPKELPSMQVISLQRLPKSTIADLSASMLGEQIGRREEIIDLLHRETEGNAFFIVEVVRALAEDAGNLNSVGMMTLPESVFAGGMKTVVKRRLQRLPKVAFGLLELAAIIGRQVDVNLMKQFSSQLDVETWLSICSNYSILEVLDDRWQFAHDKLREGVLETLDPVRKADLSQKAAEMIESYYPNAATWTAPLAQLWGMAENPQKEAYYVALAGKQALDYTALQSAIGFLQRALDLAAAAETPQFERAVLHRYLAQAYLGTDLLWDAIQQLHQALACLSRPYPKTSLGLAFSLTRAIVRQFLHRRFPKFRQRKTEQRILLERARTYALLAHLHYFRNESVPVIYSTFHEINTAESLSSATPELVRAYASAGVIIGLIPLPTLARRYMHFAHETLPQVNDDAAHAWLMTAEGAYEIGVGNLEKGANDFQAAVDLGRNMGDLRRVGDGYGGLGVALRLSAQYDRAIENYHNLQNVSQKANDIQHLVWAIDGYAYVSMYRGNYQAALDYCSQSQVHLQASQDLSNQLLHRNIQALCHLRLEQHEAALNHANFILTALESQSPALFSMIDVYAGVTEVYFRLWDQNPEAHYQTDAQRALKQLKRFTRIFPIGEPSLYLWQAYVHWFKKQQIEAFKSCEKSILAAEKHHMPLEEGTAHYRLAQHLDHHSTERRAHLEKAQAIFTTIGANWHLKRVEIAMD